jgi:hypothetical protein
MTVGFSHAKCRMTGFILWGIAACSIFLDSGSALAGAPTSQPAAIANILDQPVGDISIQGQPFKDVMDSVQDHAGVNIWIDWKALEYASIPKAAPVTVHLHQAKLSDELDAIFKSVQGKDDDSKLGFLFEGPWLKITTQRVIDDSQMEVRRYDISKLLTNKDDREGQTEDIKNYIMDHVATGKWKQRPDWVIAKSTLAPVLLICQTVKNQEKIQKLLDDLQANGGLNGGL